MNSTTNNTTLAVFRDKKDKNKALLEKLKDFMTRGKELIHIDETFFEKIDNAITQQENQKLQIVFAGGFSEGKTSIIAAWLEKHDTNMKIDTQESSDSIQKYEFDDLVIIDTPGLFGFKEDANKEKYKDKTKKFVSEAHLLLYVVDSSNPIKASHKEELHWLFRELHLLPRTIFILNKFDENADLEDEQDYEEQFAIAKENVIKGLQAHINLGNEEKANLSIVAIAANPYGEGIAYWLEHKDKFKELSRIHTLQEATKTLIAQRGRENIILELQKSVFDDILKRQLPQAEEGFKIISTEAQKLDEIAQNTQRDIEKIKGKVGVAKNNLKKWVIRYFDGLILQAKGLSIETAGDFVVREIGEGGINIDQKIQIAFENETNSLKTELDTINRNFGSELQRFESTTTKMLSQGARWLSKSGLINATNIKLARDGVVTVGKMVGLDLGLKFKPWGAVKLAKGANAALAVVGLALELWDSYNRVQKEEEFRKGIGEMVESFNHQKQELLTLLDSEDFIQQFFPELVRLVQQCQDAFTNLESLQKQKEKFEKWKEEGEIIDVEFKELR